MNFRETIRVASFAAFAAAELDNAAGTTKGGAEVGGDISSEGIG
jgi:hypothetical protein